MTLLLISTFIIAAAFAVRALLRPPKPLNPIPVPRRKDHYETSFPKIEAQLRQYSAGQSPTYQKEIEKGLRRLKLSRLKTRRPAARQIVNA